MATVSQGALLMLLAFACAGRGADWCSDSVMRPGHGPFPFHEGRNGGLTRRVQFSGFLDCEDPAYDDPTDETITEAGHSLLIDYFHTGQFGEFCGVDDATIPYVVFAPPETTEIRGVVNILPGHAGSCVGYAELLYNLRHLRARGYVFALAELRGQGFSERTLDDREKTHVETFDDYIEDLHEFTMISSRLYGANVSHVLYGHSLGATIAARYCEVYPHAYKACILSAPMLNVPTGCWDWLEEAAVWPFAVLFPRSYAFGQKPYSNLHNSEDKASNCSTRVEYQNQLRCRFQDIRLGGVTWGFVLSAIRCCKAIMQPENLGKLRSVDVLIQQGPDDVWVQPEYNEPFASDAQCQIREYYYTDKEGRRRGAVHSLLDHSDEVRNRVVADISRVILRACEEPAP
jgi:lysophospholipase